jgi:hypothetical protein
VALLFVFESIVVGVVVMGGQRTGNSGMQLASPRASISGYLTDLLVLIYTNHYESGNLIYLPIFTGQVVYGCRYHGPVL